MYTILSNNVKNDVITSGAIKKLFDNLYKKVGNSNFSVVISAEKDVKNYNVKIQSIIIDSDKGFVQSNGAELLTVCQQAAKLFMGKWRQIKSNWKKQQKQQTTINT